MDDTLIEVIFTTIDGVMTGCGHRAHVLARRATARS